MTCSLLRRPVLHSRTPTSPFFIQYRSLRLPPIQTLNPKALTESDFRDVSGKNFLCSGSVGHSFHYSHIKSKTRISFPDKTMGFLHYWTHSDLPATAGQVRFRLTSANDPSLFESGSDLLKPDGTPWAIPLAKLLKLRGNGSGFVQTLLNDGLVSKDLIRSKYFHLYEKLRLHDNSLLVESPADVFPVSLPRSTLKIYAVSSDEVTRVRLYFDDQSWVENLKLAEPGKRVHAHARVHVSGNSLPALQVVRIFTPSGAQLDSSWPSIRSVACLGRHDKAFQSWSLQTTK